MYNYENEKYSQLVMAKLRKELVLKDGVVFNNDYEGLAANGSVKIPVRDVEVEVSDYDIANGITAGASTTAYETMIISKDKAVNEIIDGYEASVVPDSIVAERLESASYSLAREIDKDGGITLLAGAETTNVSTLDKDNIYSKIVELRTQMSKLNVPNDGKRFLLVTADTMALILSAPEFIKASELGDEVISEGVLGKIAGFKVIEWNDETANLVMIAGHPRFATRASEFKVPVHLQDLSSSGKFIGASAVQGRSVYDHKVLRSQAIRAVYSPSALALTGVKGADDKVALTISGGTSGMTYKYKINPSTSAIFGESYSDGTAITSGSEVELHLGEIVEVVGIVSGKVNCVGYYIGK